MLQWDSMRKTILNDGEELERVGHQMISNLVHISTSELRFVFLDIGRDASDIDKC